MNYLLIDTTKDVANILANFNDKKYTEYIDKDLKHNENLLLKVEAILDRIDCKLADFDAFGVVTGPGSFTGIRVGISTCKAFSYALGIPTFAITNFDVLSDKYKDYIVLIPCTRTSCYYRDNLCGTCGVISDTNLDRTQKYCVLGATDKTRFEGLDCTYIEDFTDELFLYIEKNIDITKLTDSNLIEPYYLEISQAEREQNAKDNYQASDKK